jgi:hypothetical protein
MDATYLASDVVREFGIRQIPAGVRGSGESEERMGWDAFTWQMDADGRAHTITCHRRTARTRRARCTRTLPDAPRGGVVYDLSFADAVSNATCPQWTALHNVLDLSPSASRIHPSGV